VLRTAFYLNEDRILPAAPPITPTAILMFWRDNERCAGI